MIIVLTNLTSIYQKWLTYSGLELSLAINETALSLGIGTGGRGLDGVYEVLRGGRGGTGGGGASLGATMRFWWFFFSSTLRELLILSSKPKSEARD